MRFRLGMIFCLLTILLAAAVPARAEGNAAPSPAADVRSAPASLPQGVEHVATVEGIDEYRLPNGLRVLLFPDQSKPTATVNITYLVGSRCESYGETGMAHLLEHLMFKGSTNHTNIPDELTSHGARPNGSTWLDRTNYFETFSATDENLTWALDLEADRMVRSFIAKKDLESEMTVVRNELEVGENRPQSILEDRVLSTAYLWHNYGHSTIGARSDLENVPIEHLQAFYRTWYQPDNAVLVVAGKIDAGKALGLAAEKFGAIPKPERVLPVTWTAEPAQDGERTVTLHRVGDTQAVGMGYHIPAGSHPDFAAVEVLAYILGDTPSGRLYKALVETKKATSVGAWAMQFRDPGMLMMNAQARKDQSIEAVRDEMIRIADAAGASMPAAEDVDRARQSLLKDWELSLRDSQRAAIGLSEWAAMGDWRLMYIHRDRLREVKPEDVQRVAAAYLQPNNRTVGMFIPTQASERVDIPATPEIAGMVTSYAGGAGLAAGEEFDPSPANIESHVTRFTLPNGMKVALLPKKTRASTVNFAISLHFGDEQSLKGQATAADLTADMLMRGTRKHDRQQISDEMDRLKARLRMFGSATGLFGGGECASENLPDLLRLTAEILREPSFPASEFDLIKSERITDLESEKSDPGQKASTALQRHLYNYAPDDPRYSPTPEEAIARTQAATLDQAIAFYQKFYGASSAELAIVGDFQPEAVQAELAALFGDWKSPTPYRRIENPYAQVKAIEQSLETPDKDSAVFRAGLRMKLRDDSPEYPALVLANFMTGGGFLNSRLATRIRQKEGLSYGVNSWFQAGHWDENASFGAYAIYAPENDGRLVGAFREEVARVVANGFAEDEIADAKSGWLQQRRVSRSQDRDLARQLTDGLYNERDLTWDAKLEDAIRNLTPAQIQTAVRKHIRPSDISVVRAGDFANAAKKAAKGGDAKTGSGQGRPEGGPRSGRPARGGSGDRPAGATGR